MKKIFRTMLIFVLIAVMAVTCLPLTAFADVGDINFTEYESNNTTSLADRVYNDYTVSGRCGYSDIDYFKIVVSSYSTIRVVILADNAHLLMGLYDSSDDILTATRTAYVSSASSYGANFTKSVYSGTYYICLVNDSGYANNYMFYVEVTSSGGSTHTHSYSSVVTPPTCQSQGYTTYTCSCGDSYTANYTNKKNHESNDWITETPATCTSNGLRYKLCDTCGTRFGDDTLFADHNPSDWLVIKKPTKTSTGTFGTICLDCNETADSVSITLGLNNVNGMIIYVQDNGQLVRNDWVYSGGYWYYFDSNGRALTDSWVTEASPNYYVDNTGKMVANRWMLINGKWYFFGDSGRIVKNAWMKDSHGWVYLGSSGAMLTNAWCTDSKGWCYVGADGYAVTNCWKKDSIGWIWLNHNGSMTKSSWLLDGGKWYYLDANGYMVSNKWMKDSKGWVYLGSNGAMLTNAWCTDSKGWCYVGADGYAVTNCWKEDSHGWIWLNHNGSMTKSAWIKYGGYWYYLDANGYMVSDTWEKDSSGWHYLNSSGKMTSHTLDYHYHSFSPATYTEREKCSCGAERGQKKDFKIYYYDTSEPFYTTYYGARLKIDNLYFRVYDGYVKLYYDATALSAEEYEDYYCARFKLFDENGHLIDDSLFFKKMYRGSSSYGEYEYLYLTNWDGYSKLYLDVVND